jgi:hypothetical protein
VNRRLAAAVLVVAGATGCSDDPDPAAAPAGATPAQETAVTCSTSPRSPSGAEEPWHPNLLLYTGDEPDLPSEGNLEHLMRADAAAVVRYDPALAAAALDDLETWAQQALAVVVVPGDASAPLVVDVHRERLTCDGLDPGRLDDFLATRAPAEGHG